MLLTAATAMLYYRAQNSYYKLTQKILNERERIIEQIEVLRTSTNNDDQLRADLLRAKLKALDNRYDDISAFYTKFRGWYNDSD